MDFKNKVILITGASSGIGADVAVYFSKLGGLLVLVGRNEENLKIVAKKCTINGIVKRPLYIVADVTKDSETIIYETIKYFGKLDILVNNAAAHGWGSIETATMETFDSCMNTNIRATFLLTKLAIPHLATTKGNIINISSVVGLRSYTNKLPYSMSKSALDQFTKCIAMELAPKGIRVNSVNPGLIITNFQLAGGMKPNDYEHFLEKTKDAIPLGRVGIVADTSYAIAFLASELANYITGVCIAVDGGMNCANVTTHAGAKVE